MPDGNDDAALRPRGEKTRQLLLDAGAAVLPARGYHDARVDDIVEAAGVSHGSFYRYFDNKDDFFRVLAEEASTRMVELLDALPARCARAATSGRGCGDWFATYESNGGVISTWQEMQTTDRAATPSPSRWRPRCSPADGDARAARLRRPVVDAIALLAVIERLPYSVYTLRFTTEDRAIETWSPSGAASSPCPTDEAIGIASWFPRR